MHSESSSEYHMIVAMGGRGEGAAGRAKSSVKRMPRLNQILVVCLSGKILRETLVALTYLECLRQVNWLYQ